ncbi:FecR domain-containing protein [Paenibacillus oceani]|uniref:FecR domain-containing protein n=1 Tax=Paenibacillus oceani TaxID=2772510 RepID=A0A927CCB3_9BACL|nr:FecR domain-containing protein [Paenibacillus oceani]MBD2865438.1 FecR domain-containing protein [Paenibacillus oceani]
MKSRSVLSVMLCLTLLISLLTGPLAGIANAKESRAAIVVSVQGTVMVTKAGGSSPFRAVEEMSLNQGDHIRTEEGSRIVLRVADGEDEVTIGENTEMYISSLVEADDGGKKSKLKMWAGSLWFKVKKLVNADDEFEVETPTAVMGVRGSNGYIEARYGQLFALMTSGVLETRGTSGTGTGDPARVYPGQQIIQLPGTPDVGADHVTPLDVQSFINEATPEVINALLKSIQQIREENDQFIRDIADGAKEIDPSTGLALASEDDLRKFGENLKNLLANVAKGAIDTKKLSESSVHDLIDKANEKYRHDPIDLGNIKPFDLSVGLDPNVQKAKLDRLKELQEQRERMKQQEKQLEEIKKQQHAALVERLEAERKRLEEANRKAQEERERLAREQYERQLAQEERTRFLEDQRKHQEELRRQEGGAPVQPNPGTPSPGGSGGSDSGGDPGSTPDTTPPTGTVKINNSSESAPTTTLPAVTLYIAASSDTAKVMVSEALDFAGASWIPFQKSSEGDFMALSHQLSSGYGSKTIYVKLQDAAGNVSAPVSASIEYKVQPTVSLRTDKSAQEMMELNDWDSFQLDIVMNNFAANDAFYAVEVELTYGSELDASTYGYTDSGDDYIFDPDTSVSTAGQQRNGNQPTVLTYVATKFSTTDNLPPISSEKKLVTLSFSAMNDSQIAKQGTIQITKVTVVNASGDAIAGISFTANPILYQVAGYAGGN